MNPISMFRFNRGAGALVLIATAVLQFDAFRVARNAGTNEALWRHVKRMSFRYARISHVQLPAASRPHHRPARRLR
jgi:hypothetical protein